MAIQLDITNGREERAAAIGEDRMKAVYETADDMQLDQQDYVSAYCWGEVFRRDGLPKQTRILINIATLSCLGERETLKVHVRAALRLGCTRSEVREAIIQAGTIFGPVRAALACRAASEALADVKTE